MSARARLVGLAIAIVVGSSPSPAFSWVPIPFEVQVPLDRVAYRLMIAPFEANGSGGGGIRRHAQNAPRDTVIAMYRDPSSMPEAVRWTREQIDSGRCPAGQRGVTLWTFTARSEDRGQAPREWEAHKLQTCLDPSRQAPPAPPVSVPTEDPAVRKIAAEVLQRLAKCKPQLRQGVRVGSQTFFL